MGIVEEFNQAAEEIRTDPAKIPVWQPIIAKYHPTADRRVAESHHPRPRCRSRVVEDGDVAGKRNPGPTARRTRL